MEGDARARVRRHAHPRSQHRKREERERDHAPNELALRVEEIQKLLGVDALRRGKDDNLEPLRDLREELEEVRALADLNGEDLAVHARDSEREVCLRNRLHAAVDESLVEVEDERDRRCAACLARQADARIDAARNVAVRRGL